MRGRGKEGGRTGVREGKGEKRLWEGKLRIGEVLMERRGGDLRGREEEVKTNVSKR